MDNRNYQPIIYSVILVFGIIVGNVWFRDYENNLIKLIQPNLYNTKTPEFYDNHLKINAILQIVEENYVDGFDINEHEDAILQSIMSELDPHSNYIPKKEQSYIEEDMQGSFSGIGVEFNIIKDSLVVVSPISGGPSEKLGIISGDRIIEVDGEDFASVGITNSDVVENLRGEKGTEVKVKIFRRGEKESLDFTIIRGDIPMYSVDASYMIDNKTGYIKVNRLSATTNKEFYEGTQRLLLEGMQNLILDLRGNPGGYLGSAIYMCNEFLDEGELILYTAGNHRSKEEIFSDNDGRLIDTKLVVLIDEGSASASEIVSGCMQDLDRGTVIGRRSFGKGLVQEEIILDDGSAVRLTTQRYYIPSGRSIQKPYNKHEKEYYMEQYNRDENEEIADSLKFKTKNGRTVYGGGGITPDIIISRDSLLNYTNFNKIRSKNWIAEFALTYKEKVKKEDGIEALLADKIYFDFLEFAKNKSEKVDFEMGEKELNDLKLFIKATIVKSVWDKNDYFKVINSSDKYLIKALETLN
jgi:carboxyl-terminal processing protease